MKRIVELDAIRGLAALAVIAFHSRGSLFYCGWAAVDCFFVMSGFLITSIILGNCGQRGFLVRFYVRRSLRIWPIYYLSLLGLVVVNLLFFTPSVLEGLPYYLTYTQYTHHYWGGEAPAFPWYFCHTWTLALEEQFYLLWPLIVPIAGRKRLVPLAIGLVIMSLVARSLGMSSRLLVARADGFAMGALLAACLPVVDRPGRSRRAMLAGLAGVGCAALLFLAAGAISKGGAAFLGPEPLYPGPTLLALNLLFGAVIGLIYLKAGHPCLLPLRMPALVYLGQISYGLYLYHLLVFAAMAGACDLLEVGNGPAVKVLRFVLLIAVPALSWEFLERPILSLKDRLACYLSEGAPGPPTVPAEDRPGQAMRTAVGAGSPG